VVADSGHRPPRRRRPRNADGARPRRQAVAREVPVSVFDTPLDQPDAETLLRRVAEVISNAKSLPLSTSVRIEKDEVLELLQEAIDRLPEELRQARWLLKE